MIKFWWFIYLNVTRAWQELWQEESENVIIVRHLKPKDVSVGYVGGVKDVVPVWWEFHTEAEDGEMLNDFSFNELRKIIKCY